MRAEMTRTVPGHELAGARALGAVRCHIIHVAVPAAGEPLGEARLGLAELAIGDADLLKSELRAPALDVARERTEIQSSARDALP